MNETLKERIIDRFVFNNKEDLVELLDLLDTAKYERMYLSKKNGKWYVTIIWTWLVGEGA